MSPDEDCGSFHMSRRALQQGVSEAWLHTGEGVFAILAGAPGSLREPALDAVSQRVDSSRRRVWRDANGCGGAAATVSGLLPEDIHDVQPLVDTDLVFVCRVRLDNASELATQLRVSPDRVVADSHLLMLAYKAWGKACVQRLVGDYAFVAWHPRQERLMAAVDHLGAARLYWAKTGSGLVIADVLATVLSHPDIPHTPDLHALARLLDVGIDRNATPFTHVRALPGGHLLTWKAGDVRIERWWYPETRPVANHRNSRDYVDQVEELLDRAVDSQLRCTGQISSTLSGGLDSGLVTSVAARQLHRRGKGLTAYTSVPESGLICSSRPAWESDDSAYAASVAARHTNVQHVLIRPDGRCGLDLTRESCARARTPAKNSFNLIWADAISRASHAAGARVVLMGQAGNATVSWSGAGATSELLSGFQLRRMIALARAEARADGRPLWRILARASVGASDLIVRRHRKMPAAKLRSDAPAASFLRPEKRPLLHERGGLFAETPGTRAYWIAFATTPRNVWSPDSVAQWGVEWRDPLADRRLVEALLTFPLAAFKTEGLSRGLARSLGRKWLPESVAQRRTQGAQVPELPSLISRAAVRYRAALDTIAVSELCREMFDVEALRTALESIVSGACDYYASIAFERALGVAVFLADLEQGPSR
jgi:asparagine synthase (glutamine-hydrolysing)